LISLADALASELFVDVLHLNQDAVSSSITSLNLLWRQEIPSRCKSSDIQFAPQIPSLLTLPTSTTQSCPLCTPFNIKKKKKLIAEFNEFTSNNSLSPEPCSFCGTNLLSSQIHKYKCSLLDISVLESIVDQLKEIISVPSIQVFDPTTTQDGYYKVCHLCKSNITRNKFKTVPLYSYANNCWLGSVPAELVSLSYLEEQCIACT